MASGAGKGLSSARPREDDDIVHAIEDALAEDTTQFFDVDGSQNDHFDNAPLSEEEREQLQQELKKTEDEISTLRQVLVARLKHSDDLKRKLGITPWVEVRQDLSQSFKAVKESSAYQKTGEALHQATDVLSKKFGEIRSGSTFKLFGDKVGGAYNSVKAKIVASTSIDQLGQRQQNASTPNTQPTTPSSEKPIPPQ